MTIIFIYFLGIPTSGMEASDPYALAFHNIDAQENQSTLESVVVDKDTLATTMDVVFQKQPPNAAASTR